MQHENHTQPTTRLTKADIAAIEARFEAESQMLDSGLSYEQRLQTEIAALGNKPTIESLHAEGLTENSTLNAVLDFISGAGRVLTLLTAEGIQSIAPLIIGIVFAVLEYFRVFHGAEALGQATEQAALIGFAVVTANIVHPIYRVKHLRGAAYHEVIRQTGRGALAAFWNRLTGKPVTERHDWTHNPTLDLAALMITLTTVFLAVYDLIAPLLTSIIEGTATKPGLILLIELIMGLGLSLAGVFFLQAAAHEIGVRTLTDQPTRLAEILERRRAAHMQQAADIRRRVRDEYIAAEQARQSQLIALREQITQEYILGKIADEQRRKGLDVGVPFGNTQTVDRESTPTTPNGSGPTGSANGSANGSHNHS